MKISTRGRYALRILVELANNEGEGLVSLSELAGRQKLPKKYLEQIIPLLVDATILETARGPKGGYRLARKTSEIAVGEILRLTEGSLAPVACADVDAPRACERRDVCKTYPLWKKLSRMIADYLDSVTLADLVAGTVDLNELPEAKNDREREAPESADA